MKTLLFIFANLTILATFALGQIRINSENFGMAESELRTLFDQTVAVFPKDKSHQDPALFIAHHSQGPITLFQRTPRNEIAIQLSAKNRYYAQIIYQFAHEFAHVRAQTQPLKHENKWLEEVFCEVASLYVLRELSTQWQKKAPNPALKNYHQKLATYATKVMKTRSTLNPQSSATFYQKHRSNLRKSSTNRSINGAFAVLILPLLEAQPEHWQTLHYFPHKKGLSLIQHFEAWRKASPKKHHHFLTHVESFFLAS